MPYQARVFRVLIASPSDVQTEREIIARTLFQWNDEKSNDLNVVLLPLRWETNSSPDYGKHPQEILNEQLLGQCDILIGVFWTRLGTPTSQFVSGTVEEIERVAGEGKPVVLYFSQAKKTPDEIDLEQLQGLREFRDKVREIALIEHFTDQVDLRDKLMKALTYHARRLTPDSNDDQPEQVITDIRLSFTDPSSEADLGQSIDLECREIVVIDEAEIPDFKTEPAIPMMSYNMPNKNYYRDIIEYIKQQELFVPLQFGFKNIGYMGAKDIYIELRFYSDGSDFLLVKRENMRRRPAKIGTLFYGGFAEGSSGLKIRKLERSEPSWIASFEIPALQPMRELSPDWGLAIACSKDCQISVEAEIYADMLSEPTNHSLRINAKATRTELSASDLLTNISKLESNEIRSLFSSQDVPIRKSTRSKAKPARNDEP